MIFNRVILNEDLRKTIDSIRRNCPNIPLDEEFLKEILSIDPTLKIDPNKDFFKNNRGTFTDWLLRLYNKDPKLFNMNYTINYSINNLSWKNREITADDITDDVLSRYFVSWHEEHMDTLNDICDELEDEGYDISWNFNHYDDDVRFLTDSESNTELIHRLKNAILLDKILYKYFDDPNFNDYEDSNLLDDTYDDDYEYNQADEIDIDTTTGNQIKDLLIKFVLFCNKKWLTPPENSIDHYKSVNDLASTVKQVEAKPAKGQVSIEKLLNFPPRKIEGSGLSDYEVETWFQYQKQFIDPNKELPVVFKDNHYTVYQVNSLRADMLLGESSSTYGKEKAGWCTCVQTDSNLYYHYFDESDGDPYYVIIDTLNNKCKYQCHLGSMQLFDAVPEGNVPSEHAIGFNKFADDPDLIDFFYDKLDYSDANIEYLSIRKDMKDVILLTTNQVETMSPVSLLMLSLNDQLLVLSTIEHWLTKQAPSILKNYSLVRDAIIDYITDTLTENSSTKGNHNLIKIDDPQEAEVIANHIFSKLDSIPVGRSLKDKFIKLSLDKLRYLIGNKLISTYYYSDNNPICQLGRYRINIKINLALCTARYIAITGTHLDLFKKESILDTNDDIILCGKIKALNAAVNFVDRLSEAPDAIASDKLASVIDQEILRKNKSISDILYQILNNKIFNDSQSIREYNLEMYYKFNDANIRNTLIPFISNNFPELYQEYNSQDFLPKSRSYYYGHRYLESYKRRRKRYHRYY